ncbi:MAG: hypothetical protein AAGF92_05870 [Myxococcota bacterium]
MALVRSSLWLGCWLTSLLFLIGCGNEGPSGSVALDLVLADGAAIDTVDWRITGNGMAPMEGNIDTSAPGSTVSLEVFGLQAGDDYLLELFASSEDGLTTCKGSVNFSVSVGRVTEVFVMLQCSTEPTSGGVRVETEINLCGELIKVVVAPLRTSIGNDIDLQAEAVDREGDPLEYFWSASGGSIANPSSPDTTYTCGQEGQQFVRIQVSDADHCVDEWTVPVTCVDRGGTGGTGGGTGGSGGTGGFAGTGGSAGCESTCGTFNEFPNGGPVDGGFLDCDVMGIPIPLEFDLTAISQQPIAPGQSEITSAFQTIIPASVVNLILALADSVDVTDTLGFVFTTAQPSPIAIGLSPVPCLVCFQPDVPVVVTNDPNTTEFFITGTSIDLELTEVTVSLNAAGLPLTLTTDGPDPNCVWQGPPPRVSLGSGGTGGVGGTGGTGGTGGSVGMGLCTDSADSAALENAEYTNDDGDTFFGDAAVAEIANDCVLGATTLVSDGCGSEAALVIGNNSEENRAALAACVEDCILEQGIDLSSGCLSCYGDTVSCTTAFCIGPCAASTSAPGCIQCQCDNNCFQDFDVCSGLPSGNECNGGTGGSGGTGAVGGTAGSGGVGGTGGFGGSPGCQQTCGIGNEFPSGSTVESRGFECAVMGIPIPLSFNFTALAADPIASGNNDITLAAQTVIPEDVVDLILALADSATITNTTGSVDTSGLPSRLSLILTDVPCEVCFFPGTPVEVTIDPRTETFSVSDGSISLDLSEVTVIIDAGGLELVLSNVGADPNCTWDGGSPPSITLGAPAF